MSKELEALENDIESLYSIITQSRINKELKGWAHVWRDDIIRDLRKTLTRPLDSELEELLNWLELDLSSKATLTYEPNIYVDILRQALRLTPKITSDMVCEELGKWFNREVIFKQNSFHIRYEDETKVVVINHLTKSPRLITMIGRFYESLEE